MVVVGAGCSHWDIGIIDFVLGRFNLGIGVNYKRYAVGMDFLIVDTSLHLDSAR